MPTGDPMEYPPMYYHFKAPPDIDLSPAIAGVMGTLPPPGSPWPQEARARFLAALGAVLDLVYPETRAAYRFRTCAELGMTVCEPDHPGCPCRAADQSREQQWSSTIRTAMSAR